MHGSVMKTKYATLDRSMELRKDSCGQIHVRDE